MIPSSNITFKTLKNDLGGYQNIKAEPQPNIKLDEKTLAKIEASPLTTDEYIIMEQFAQYLPRGKRKMKLNIPELRTELLSYGGLNALTDSDGLRSGGSAAMTNNFKANPKKSTKEIKEMEQKNFNLTIKNNNRVSSKANLNNGKNPNYTSFKNNFIIY